MDNQRQRALNSKMIKKTIDEIGNRELIEQRQEFARYNSWEARANDFINFIS